MDPNTTRRGNYESRSDYVLEHGELRFTFNERDFAEGVEPAAIKLEFVPGRLAEEEREDLVNLAVNGEVGEEPHSTLGEHVNASWHRLPPPPPPPRPPPPGPARRLRALARALAAAARVPRRLARPACARGRARDRLRRQHPHVRLRPARPRL